MQPVIHRLRKKANWLRNKVLDMCIAGGGHLASAFSCVEIMVALYYGGILRFDSGNPDWDGRDRFILSKGHAAPVLYAILSDLGFFAMDELDSYCQPGSILGSHPDKIIPGVEVTTGSLGHGLGVAAGMALAAKMDNAPYMTVALLGDGECSEGSVWEAAMFASCRQLDNLVGVVDRNHLCVTGFTEDCIRLNPFAEKWKSFVWDVIEINGHSFEEIINAFKDFRRRRSGKPLMVIAHTVKGKGVSFMENNPFWHTKIPAGEQIESAKKELLWKEDEKV
jgi:transketolase